MQGARMMSVATVSLSSWSTESFVRVTSLGTGSELTASFSADELGRILVHPTLTFSAIPV